MVNTNKLKGKIVEKGLNVERLAEMMGVDKSTLYRKINSNGETLTIKEVELIINVLNLKIQDINSIFFASEVA